MDDIRNCHMLSTSLRGLVVGLEFGLLSPDSSLFESFPQLSFSKEKGDGAMRGGAWEERRKGGELQSGCKLKKSFFQWICPKLGRPPDCNRGKGTGQNSQERTPPCAKKSWEVNGSQEGLLLIFCSSPWFVLLSLRITKSNHRCLTLRIPSPPYISKNLY